MLCPLIELSIELISILLDKCSVCLRLGHNCQGILLALPAPSLALQRGLRHSMQVNSKQELNGRIRATTAEEVFE